jgi:hypothetical protein
VAHEQNIKSGSVHCEKGYTVRVADLVHGKTKRKGIADAAVNDIWTTEDEGHTGVVRAVDKASHSVTVQHCSSNPAKNGVVTEVMKKGHFFH